MANLIIITGPQAVGKMTVAEKLKEKIGYSLMVNHDSIETALKIFGDNKAGRELNKFIRKKVFELATDENIDMIFTYIIDFSSPNEYEYINSLKSMFEKTGGKLYIVELFADVKTRLERNVTPNRLEKKASKRNAVLHSTYLGVGLGVSILFLSTLIPKMQYWITKLRTGKDGFPGVDGQNKAA